MVKFYRISTVFILAFFLIFISSCDKADNGYEEVIRIHIRANSNSSNDQEIKYIVKEKIIEYITPLSCGLNSYSQMVSLLEDNLDELEIIADDILKENNIEYKATVRIVIEEYPARSYDGIVFPAGMYKSLIIDLGNGKGDNWWCVAYPPLCFIAIEDKGEDYFRYKSKILEIFNER